MRMAFQIFDFNNDNYVCSFDLYTFLKTYEFDNELFVRAFAQDLILLESVLAKRRKHLGLENAEVTFKLKDFDDELMKLGGRLEVQTLQNYLKMQTVPVEQASNDSESVSDISEDKYNLSVHKSVKPRSRTSRRHSFRSTKSLRQSASRASSFGSVGSSEKSQNHHPWDKVFTKTVNTNI